MLPDLSFEENYKNAATLLQFSYLIYKSGDESEYETGLKCLSISFIWGNSFIPNGFEFFNENFTNFFEKKSSKSVIETAKFYLEKFEKDKRPNIEFYKKITNLIIVTATPSKARPTVEEIILKMKDYLVKKKHYEISHPFFDKGLKMIIIDGKERCLINIKLNTKEVKTFRMFNIFKDMTFLLRTMYGIKTLFFIYEFKGNYWVNMEKSYEKVKTLCFEGVEYGLSVNNLLISQDLCIVSNDFETGIIVGHKIMPIHYKDHPEYPMFFYNHMYLLLGGISLLGDPSKVELLLPGITEEEKKLERHLLQEKFGLYLKKMFDEQELREKSRSLDPKLVYENSKKEEVEKLLKTLLKVKELTKHVKKMERQNEVCMQCKKKATEVKLKKCSNCEQVFYCGVECQKLHWKIHKLECEEMKKNPKVYQYQIFNGEPIKANFQNKYK